MYPKEKSLDHHLRATWQAVAKMYNEEATKHESTMATGFMLLNIDQEKGTASTALGPKMGMESTSLSRLLKKHGNKRIDIQRKKSEGWTGCFYKINSTREREKRRFKKKCA